MEKRDSVGQEAAGYGWAYRLRVRCDIGWVEIEVPQGRKR